MTTDNDPVEAAVQAAMLEVDRLGPAAKDGFSPYQAQRLAAEQAIRAVATAARAAMPCYDALAAQAFERGECGERWLCPSCQARAEVRGEG